MPRIACLCLLIIAAHPAAAQRWCDSSPRDSVSYSQCALRLDGDYLVRGIHRETVAMADPYQPLHLLHFVFGDSAIKYATRYERDASRSGAVRFVGDLLFLVGNFTALGQRRYSPHGVTVGRTGPIMMITGVSIHLASYPLQWRAEREGDSAVRWNNAGLRRDP